jgi:gamma-glutamyl hydrolase
VAALLLVLPPTPPSMVNSAATFLLGPVIAIFAQPLSWEEPGTQYIAASYVKWVESAGGRVIAMDYHASDAEVDALFDQVNGVLFPGGGAALPGAARRVYERAVEANDAGDPFALWGTCLGLEWLMDMGANHTGTVVRGGFQAENVSLPLGNLTSEGRDSPILKEARMVPVLNGKPGPTRSVLEAMETLPLTINLHSSGTDPQDLAANAQLSDSFGILATQADLAGKKFVSMAAGRHGRPFVGVQFHPEKNAWEQVMQVPSEGSVAQLPFQHIAHSIEGVQMGQFFANYFVRHARRSTHQFKDAAALYKRLLSYGAGLQQPAPSKYVPQFSEIYSFTKDYFS